MTIKQEIKKHTKSINKLNINKELRDTKGYATKYNPFNDPTNLQKAIYLRNINNLSYKQIADQFGVTPSAVFQKIKKHTNNLLNDFINEKELHLNELQFELVKGMNKAKIADMRGKDTVVSIGILEDKLQKMGGLNSPNNLTINILSAIKGASKPKEVKIDAEVVGDSEIGG